MKSKELILASKSPRRKELLDDIGLSFTIYSDSCVELFDHNISKEEAIEQIAYTKADVVFEKHRDAIVIGADTMVYCEGAVLGKPNDKADAKEMLVMLSGKTHEVITGVVILCEDKQIKFHETTKVTFYELEESLIDWYLDTLESFDKAGAYGIQGKGKLLVKKIQGDYFNVVGLPVARLYRELMKFIA